MAKEKMPKNEEEWKKKLTSAQYHVLREKRTEKAFTGKYLNTKEKGMYNCAGCGSQLFSSETKFDSGTGWPSFSDSANRNTIILKDDYSYGIHRTEVLCKKCNGHLGHVFNDGPKGKRYCINSCSLEMKKDYDK